MSILLISPLLSDYTNKSLITGVGYIRFGLFIFVISFLINKKKFLNKLYFILTTLFLVLFFDSAFQKLTGSNILEVSAPDGRITSLFGEDIKLGGFVQELYLYLALF